MKVRHIKHTYKNGRWGIKMAKQNQRTDRSITLSNKMRQEIPTFLLKGEPQTREQTCGIVQNILGHLWEVERHSSRHNPEEKIFCVCNIVHLSTDTFNFDIGFVSRSLCKVLFIKDNKFFLYPMFENKDPSLPDILTWQDV